MSEYTPYNYKGKTMLIERYLVLGEQKCAESEYDMFDMSENPLATKKMAEIEQNGYGGFDVYDEIGREGLNAFKFYEHPENKKIFLYSEVFSKTKTKILICMQATTSRSRLWINGRFLVTNQTNSHYYLTATLDKGKNTFLFEQFSPDPGTYFSIQIRNYKFEMSDDIRALSNMKHVVQIDPLILISEPCYRPTESTFRFMYIKNGVTLKPDYRLVIQDSKADVVKTLTAHLGETIEINLDELRALHPETLRHEWLECVFKDKENKDVVTGFFVCTNDFSHRLEEIHDQLLLAGAECAPSIHECFAGKAARMKILLENHDYLGAYLMAWWSQKELKQFGCGNYVHDFYKMPGVHEFFIHSELDDSYIKMFAKLPQSYDKNETYPVFIALAAGNEGWFSWGMPDELSEPCLCFDVTGRGYTGGSFVGEASTLEVIDWIKRNYKVDEDRIYVLGQSNGGFATWSLAQNHPHMPAAIFPLIGYPQIETIDNVSNIPAYQMVSPKDYVFKGREDEMKKKTFRYGHYNEIRFEEMIHNTFVFYNAHKGILNQMLSTKRNSYPRQVIYKTCRNRHLESFWIKLHGIENGEKFAKIKAVIENERLIKITSNGTMGITVTLPPQMEKNSFDVSVNGKVFHFERPDHNQIHFTHGRKWEIADHPSTPDFRKGTGLLDIYMDSLRIITPEDSGEGLLKTAEHFSKPTTNGYDTKVYTNYPVYTPNDVPDHIFGHNLILLDTADHPNPYVSRFADKLPVNYDQTGYTYKDIRIEGGYVVMQVIPNPYDARRTFLIISTNDKTLLKKHMLLRKVIIPTYINGIHPLWNNGILVFDGKNYLAAYETGDALSGVN